MKSKKDRLQQLKRQVEYVKNLPITSEANRPVVNSSQLNESSFELNRNDLSNIQSEHNEDFGRELEDSALESKTLKEYTAHPFSQAGSSYHVRPDRILKELESAHRPVPPARPVRDLKQPPPRPPTSLQMPKQLPPGIKTPQHELEGFPVKTDNALVGDTDSVKLKQLEIENAGEGLEDEGELITEKVAENNLALQPHENEVSPIESYAIKEEILQVTENQENKEFDDPEAMPFNQTMSPANLPNKPIDISPIPHNSEIVDKNEDPEQHQPPVLLPPPLKDNISRLPPKAPATRPGLRGPARPLARPPMMAPAQPVAKTVTAPEDTEKTASPKKPINREGSPKKELIEENQIEAQEPHLNTMEDKQDYGLALEEQPATLLIQDLLPPLKAAEDTKIADSSIIPPPKPNSVDAPIKNLAQPAPSPDLVAKPQILTSSVPAPSEPESAFEHEGALFTFLPEIANLIAERDALKANNTHLNQTLAHYKHTFESEKTTFRTLLSSKESQINDLLQKLKDSSSQCLLLQQQKVFLEEQISDALETNRKTFSDLFEQLTGENQALIEDLKARVSQLDHENYRLKGQLNQISSVKTQAPPDLIELQERLLNEQRSLIDQETIAQAMDRSEALNEELSVLLSDAVKTINTVNVSSVTLDLSTIKESKAKVVDIEQLLENLKAPAFDVSQFLSIPEMTEPISKKAVTTRVSLQKDIGIGKSAPLRPDKPITTLNNKVDREVPKQIIPIELKKDNESKLETMAVTTNEAPNKKALKDQSIEQNKPDQDLVFEPVTQSRGEVATPEVPITAPITNPAPIPTVPDFLQEIVSAGNHNDEFTENQKALLLSQEGESAEAILEISKPQFRQSSEQRPPADFAIHNDPIELPPLSTQTNISRLMAPPRNKILAAKGKGPLSKPGMSTSNAPFQPQKNLRTNLLARSDLFPTSEPENSELNGDHDDNQAIFDQLDRSGDSGLPEPKNTQRVVPADPDASVRTNQSAFDLLPQDASKKRHSIQTTSLSKQFDGDTRSERNLRDTESVEETISLKNVHMTDLHEYNGKAPTNPFAAKKDPKETNVFKKKVIQSRQITQGIPDNLF